MSASELYKAGRLAEAVAAQTQEVRANPADHARRLFLFELLAFAGDLERARRQIDALQYDDPELQAAVVQYRQLLDSEQARRDFVTKGKPPQFLMPPPDHVRLRLEAVNQLRGSDPAKAAQWVEHADGIIGNVAGSLNGTPFANLRDADGILGPVLEVFAQGGYYWVPLAQVESVRMNPPRFPRDLLYVPARLETETQSGEVFLPALYAGSHAHPDDEVKLGRKTDWVSEEGGPVRGVGLRTFLAGDEPVTLLEWRELLIHGAQEE
jgi:type VI secretion system protein ImpE